MSEHQWKAFTVTIADGIAEVTLIGPGKGNVMGPDFWNELPAVFAELDRDDAVRVVVLSGSGKNFSYGLDLPGMAGDLAPALAPDSRAAARTRFHDMILRMQSGVNAVADCRKPVIAAIWGWCIGGGVDLITAADFRYASADAKFSIREVKVGMVADMGTLARIPAIIGDGHFRELALTGRDIDAARADGELTEEQEEKLYRELAREYPVFTSDTHLNDVATDFVEHFHQRWRLMESPGKPGNPPKYGGNAKAMLVCIDKITCAKMAEHIKIGRAHV